MNLKKLNAEKLSLAISPYDDYCEGYGNSGSSGNGYILGTFLGIGKAQAKLGHSGSRMLDEINAFDLAETDGPYIGQINMSIVSSFCGPQGLIWGYDLAVAKGLRRNIDRSTFPKYVMDDRSGKIPVCSILPLVEATRSLFGTVDKKKFPLKPGAHVPCAGKNIKAEGPGRIYAGVAIGVAKNRDENACLLMEDTGQIPLENSISQDLVYAYEDMICTQLAESVVQIGHNQKVEYAEIFVGVKSIAINKDEIGCALVACPYFTIAKNAVKTSKKKEFDFSDIIESNIDEWLSKH
jgi:histidine decarboxylase